MAPLHQRRLFAEKRLRRALMATANFGAAPLAHQCLERVGVAGRTCSNALQRNKELITVRTVQRHRVVG